MSLDRTLGFETKAIHAGQAPDPSTGAVMTPITLSTTFVQESPGHHKGYEYIRTSNPTRKAYEDCLASLESGAYGMAFASGCAALTTLLHLFKQGDHIISMDGIYGGSIRVMRDFQNQGLQLTIVDMTHREQLEKALRKNTKLIWIETPTNPLLKIVDVVLVSKIAQEQNILVAVDNTFMTPFFQKPLLQGADIICHSTSKYIGGHSDLLGGALVVDNKELADRLYFLQNALGAVASPFDSFLCLRSLKTLAVRMKAHDINATQVATFLESHPQIERVLYPGLKNHPQHTLAKQQMDGFGGMVSFYIKGGLSETQTFLKRLKIITLAESLGGVESLIDHPAIMTHAYLSKKERLNMGISDNLLRLSVGIESAEDLITDLKEALKPPL